VFPLSPQSGATFSCAKSHAPIPFAATLARRALIREGALARTTVAGKHFVPPLALRPMGGTRPPLAAAPAPGREMRDSFDDLLDAVKAKLKAQIDANNDLNWLSASMPFDIDRRSRLSPLGWSALSALVLRFDSAFDALSPSRAPLPAWPIE
jgi:hypothetical protein